MSGQITWFPSLQEKIDKRNTAETKLKRNWENAFQKWSDYMGLGNGSTEDYGCCGYGSMCDWCEDNSYGRPCVRALNAMLREKGKKVDYDDTDFVKVWRGW